MYFKKIKYAMQYQKSNGGVVWYDNVRKVYYVLSE